MDSMDMFWGYVGLGIQFLLICAGYALIERSTRKPKHKRNKEDTPPKHL